MTGAIYLCVTRGEEWGDTEGASGLGAGLCSGSNGDPNGDNRDLSGANGDPSGDLSGVNGGVPIRPMGIPMDSMGISIGPMGAAKQKGAVTHGTGKLPPKPTESWFAQFPATNCLPK